MTKASLLICRRFAALPASFPSHDVKDRGWWERGDKDIVSFRVTKNAYASELAHLLAVLAYLLAVMSSNITMLQWCGISKAGPHMGEQNHSGHVVLSFLSSNQWLGFAVLILECSRNLLCDDADDVSTIACRFHRKYHDNNSFLHFLRCDAP